MKYFLTLLLAGLISFQLTAQTGSYYVSSKSLNLRSTPNQEAEVVKKLKQYDNLKVVQSSESNWVKVSYNSTEGYVWKSYLKKGRAIVSSYEVRTGARCKDGTSSSATGRGACSHHGGVSYWKTRTERSVRIVDN